jgi:hypothetical protein
MSQSATDELQATVNIVEETYEFCLAYAAKGVGGLMARTGDTQVRDQLEKLGQALPNLADVFLKVVEENEGDGKEQYKGFIEVLRRDAEAGHAAVSLVLAQENITSQMVDNLNGMIHLRALLTDVFLIDEMLRPEAEQPLHIQPAE